MTTRVFTWLVHSICWLPFLSVLIDYAAGNLTANPIQTITQRTGYTSLILLEVSLACTPLGIYLGLPVFSLVRRLLGLYAFYYATLHIITFIVLDYRTDFQLIWVDISEKNFIFVGAIAFVILVVLAITTNRTIKYHLGKTWTLVHRLVYLAAVLVVIHFAWAVKADARESMLHGAVVLVLLGARLPWIKNHLSNHALGLKTLFTKRSSRTP